jgi:hypothetical protein
MEAEKKSEWRFHLIVGLLFLAVVSIPWIIRYLPGKPSDEWKPAKVEPRWGGTDIADNAYAVFPDRRIAIIAGHSGDSFSSSSVERGEKSSTLTGITAHGIKQNVNVPANSLSVLDQGKTKTVPIGDDGPFLQFFHRSETERFRNILQEPYIVSLLETAK